MYKIAIITPYGAEERLDHYAEFILAKGLVAHGEHVQFYTYAIQNNPDYRNGLYQGVNVRRCWQKAGIAPGLFFSILRFRPDFVCYFHPRSFLSFTAYVAGRCVGAKIISEIVGILHDPFIVGDPDNPLETIKAHPLLIRTWRDFFTEFFLLRWSLLWTNLLMHLPIAKADVIVAINRDEANYIHTWYGRSSTLIYWSIPQSEKHGENDQPSFYHDLPNEYLLFLGQIKKRKGWDTVIEALALLKDQGIIKKLVFVSPSKDLTLAREYAKKYGVENHIVFLSSITNQEKKWLYDHAQSVLAPSRYEGFGLPVFEGFVAGKPVLATKIPVYEEFLVHGKNALLSESGNARALADSIISLDKDPVLGATLVAEGYRTAAEFSDTIMISKFVQLFASMK